MRSSSLRVFLGASSAAAALLGASQAFAQDAIGTVKVEEQAGAFTLQSTKDQGYKAERSLTATKTDTELKDVPQSITVITRQELEDRAVQSMAEAVQYVPGVTFAQGEGNRDTPVLRGNATTADFFIDGVRDDVQFFRDVYNLERVEVLRGANAMIFGRGGAGGVINRVTRQAAWERTLELKGEVGSDEHYRGSFDVGNGVSDSVALRLTGVLEDSGVYRDHVELERWGLNPTASIRLGDDTLVQVGYEHFEDERTADRGVSSFGGRPLDTDPSTFFGNPDASIADATVDAVSLAVEHHFANGWILRNRTRWADYDKFYQNVFPGAVNATGTQVAIAAYNNATDRTNLINQTDLNVYASTGSINHTILAGVELGRQETDNRRMTGFFGAATSISVPVSSPTTSVVPTFRPSATDADNHGVVEFAAVYLQDQIELNPQWQLVLGLRYDRFDVDFRNNRTGLTIGNTDNLWSPRAGVIFKPTPEMSLYASYGLTYAPRAGDQLSSLTLSNRALDPEEFRNYEVGVKWDVRPELSVAAAVFQLDRRNVAIADAVNPAITHLVDGQRTRGVEVEARGRITERWSVIAAYAFQEAEITRSQSATVLAGAQLANTPRHSLSVWNRYELTDALGVGLGVVHQAKRYTSTDNTVSLPAYTRVDAAGFWTINDSLSAQLNVENLLDEDYFVNAHNNNNISPGSPRAFRLSLTARY